MHEIELNYLKKFIGYSNTHGQNRDIAFKKNISRYDGEKANLIDVD